jgi:hypothetical protein
MAHLVGIAGREILASNIRHRIAPHIFQHPRAHIQIGIVVAQNFTAPPETFFPA